MPNILEKHFLKEPQSGMLVFLPGTNLISVDNREPSNLRDIHGNLEISAMRRFARRNSIRKTAEARTSITMPAQILCKCSKACFSPSIDDFFVYTGNPNQTTLARASAPLSTTLMIMIDKR